MSGTDRFAYRGHDLWCEDVRVEDLAREHGTPLYVYSASCVRDRFRELRTAFGDGAQICYAVKANSNLSILKLLASLGAGFDLVSGGELLRVQKAGIDASRAIFAGAAKQRWEIELGAKLGVRAFQVESPHEIELLSAVAAAQSKRLPVALRLNPAVAVDTHAYIATAKRDSKFGIELARAGEAVSRIAKDPGLQLVGYHVHLGSQLREVAPYVRAFERVAEFMDGAEERRDGVRHYDLGGGFGIPYGHGDAFPLRELASRLSPLAAARGLQLMLEPGRYLVGDAGVLVAEVLGHKQAGDTKFVLVDAAMNDLLRPSLYSAEHPIVPCRDEARASSTVDVVGPVCESGDFLARARSLPRLCTGERIAVLAAGAYGASMASCYNTRRRPAEVLVDGASHRQIRRRETFEELWAGEEPAEDNA
jgi:diaminopimelate decarboxylase